MKIHEYQGKEIFARYGIPIPKGYPARNSIDHFLAAKREEWQDYIKHVSPWEIERYLGVY